MRYRPFFASLVALLVASFSSGCTGTVDEPQDEAEPTPVPVVEMTLQPAATATPKLNSFGNTTLATATSR